MQFDRKEFQSHFSDREPFTTSLTIRECEELAEASWRLAKASDEQKNQVWVTMHDGGVLILTESPCTKLVAVVVFGFRWFYVGFGFGNFENSKRKLKRFKIEKNTA